MTVAAAPPVVAPTVYYPDGMCRNGVHCYHCGDEVNPSSYESQKLADGFIFLCSVCSDAQQYMRRQTWKPLKPSRGESCRSIWYARPWDGQPFTAIDYAHGRYW